MTGADGLVRRFGAGPEPACPKPADRLSILIHHDLSDRYRPLLEARFPRLRQTYVKRSADLAAALAQERPDAVLTFRIKSEDGYPRDLLLGAPSVRWLHVGSAGVDHLGAWDPSRVMVTNSSGIHAEAMAQYAAWAVLHHILRMPLFAAQQARREWRHYEVRLARRFSALVVGFGRIGTAVGRSLTQLGLAVTGIRMRPEPAPGAALRVIAPDGLAAALAEADFVILTLPRTPASTGLFDAGMLGRMKRGACLINLARGGIVDEAALRAALASGALGAAVFDVFGAEPLAEDDPLWTTPGLIVTPHAAADVENWHTLVAELFAANLERWMAGQPLINLCDPQRGY